MIADAMTTNDLANAFGIVFVGVLLLLFIWMLWMLGSKGED